MQNSDPHDRLKPAVVSRPLDLPADVIHAREVEWLGELKTRLAAVEVWRGFSRPRTRAKHKSADIRSQ